MKYHITLLMSIFVVLFSCKDPCIDKNCNKGYCIEGDCFCEDGYSGENCEIKESDKFVGLYVGTEELDNIILPINVNIKNDFETPRDVSIEVDNGTSIMLAANIKDDSIFISNQFLYIYETNGDSTLQLIYPSSGILKNDSLLFDLVVKSSNYPASTIDIKVKKN
ncbi:MAG: hypothetical protein R2771_01795 [Saprospiraceae bacterium]